MRHLTRCTLASVATLLLFPPCGSLRAEEKIDVRVVKYSGLADTIKQNKGKVIVVDFWAEW